MPDEVGSMSVAYTIVVNQALKALNTLKAGITDVIKKTQEWNESGDKQESKLKSIGKAWALVGAVATAALYGIMKSSSYAAIYSKQFGAQIQRVANILMEKTGLTAAVEGALEVIDRFIDRIDDGNLTLEEFLNTLKDITKWWDELSATSKVIIAITGVLTIIGVFIGGVIAAGMIIKGFAAGIIAIKGAVVALGLKLGLITAWFLGLPLWVAVAIGAIIGLIAVWILWKTGVLQTLYDLGERFGTWLQELGAKFGEWVFNTGVKIGTWIQDMGNKFGELVSKGIELFGSLWDSIIDGAGIMKTKFFGIITSMIDKVKNLISKILSIPKAGTSFLGGLKTSISSGSMMGGGDSHQFGGPIKETGLNLLHGGEYVIPKAGKLISSGGGGNTYNISTTVNVAPGTSSNMAGEISRQVSKSVADEVRRITKV